MKVTKIGHCCLLVELGGLRIMTDPGRWTAGAHSTEKDIDVILITHEHGDHLHVESLKTVVANNTNAVVLTNADVGDILHAEGIPYTVVDDGDTHTVGDVLFESYDGPHEEIYGDFGIVHNTGYFIGGVLFYPGDAFTEPKKEVPVLALPVAGPWCTIKDAIDYAKRVRPTCAFPVHDGMLRYPEVSINHAVRELPAANIDFVPLADGDTHTFTV